MPPKKKRQIPIKLDDAEHPEYLKKLKDTFTYVVELVEHNIECFKKAFKESDAVLNIFTKEETIAVLKKNGLELQFARDVLKSDEDVVLEAYRQNPKAAEFSKLTDDLCILYGFSQEECIKDLLKRSRAEAVAEAGGESKQKTAEAEAGGESKDSRPPRTHEYATELWEKRGEPKQREGGRSIRFADNLEVKLEYEKQKKLPKDDVASKKFITFLEKTILLCRHLSTRNQYMWSSKILYDRWGDKSYLGGIFPYSSDLKKPVTWILKRYVQDWTGHRLHVPNVVLWIIEADQQKSHEMLYKKGGRLRNVTGRRAIKHITETSKFMWPKNFVLDEYDKRQLRENLSNMIANLEELKESIETLDSWDKEESDSVADWAEKVTIDNPRCKRILKF